VGGFLLAYFPIYGLTGSMETVSLILGHEGGIDVSMRYVDVDPRVLRQAFAEVI